MKKFLIMVLCFSIAGCGTVQTRMMKLKDRNIDTEHASYRGTIEESKKEVRAIGKDLSLIEAPAAETNNFLVLRNNLLKSSTLIALFGGIAGSMLSNPTKLGFFFDYDKDKDITNISISEEGNSIRHMFADKLKIKNLELANAK